MNALQFVATRDKKFLVSASSIGGIFVNHVTGADDAPMTDGDSVGPLSVLAVPQWEQVFAGTSATCVEVSENRTCLVTASAGGALAMLKLDDHMSVDKIGEQNTKEHEDMLW